MDVVKHFKLLTSVLATRENVTVKVFMKNYVIMKEIIKLDLLASLRIILK